MSHFMLQAIFYAFCQLSPALVTFFVIYEITDLSFDRREVNTFVQFQ